MIIECAYCNSKVDGKVLAKHKIPSGKYWDKSRYVFLVCPVCNSPHVGGSDEIQVGPDDYEWSDLKRLWPNPPQHLDSEVPKVVRESISEAEKCYRAEAYGACAVMCGRALEGMCTKLTGEKTIFNGLQELKNKGVIDNRLFTWAESLRVERNVGAHASEETTSKEDAMKGWSSSKRIGTRCHCPKGRQALTQMVRSLRTV